MRSSRGTGRTGAAATTTVLALVAVVGLGATTTASAVDNVGHARARPAPRYYVSLGDSYSVGYQPGRGQTRNGFPDQVVAKAARRGLRLRLVNFGCGGATTTSIQVGTSCPLAAVQSPGYGGLSQTGAAEAFLRAHVGQVALITVSIGGNDVTKCVGSPDPVSCVAQATTAIKTNVSQLAADLRAAGPAVPIVGTTYPDVVLGAWVRPPANRPLARLSIIAFQALINPALRQSYASAGGRLVDVTKRTGAYIPLTRTVTLKPYGVIPVAVARVCTLTYYCDVGDIHAKTPGYGVIADLIVATLPRR
jgi:lysophospholipase L1-like esterase